MLCSIFAVSPDRVERMFSRFVMIRRFRESIRGIFPELCASTGTFTMKLTPSPRSRIACILCAAGILPFLTPVPASAATITKTSALSGHDAAPLPPSDGFTASEPDAVFSTTAQQTTGATAPIAAPRHRTVYRPISSRRARNYHARVRTAVTWFEVPVESKVGGSYAFEIARPLEDGFGIYASVSANHFSTGSQYLGTVGLYKQADLRTGDPLDRMSHAVLFDNFAETRLGWMYLSQLRLSTSYALDHQTAIGVRGGINITDDNRQVRTNPAGIFVPFTFYTSDHIEAFISRQVGDVLLTGAMGYRDNLNNMTWEASARMPVSERVACFTNARYEESGVWASTVGFEIALGRSSTCRTCRRPSSNHSLLADASTTAGSSPTIIRGQSAGPGNFFTGGSNPAPWNDPLMGGGSFFNYTPADFWELVPFEQIFGPVYMPIVEIDGEEEEEGGFD